MNAVRARLLAAALVLAACGPAPADPTPTPALPVYGPSVVPSATVNPVAPLVEGPGIREQSPGGQGASNPTQAGLAAEGQPAADLPTITPLPTQAQLPMMITAPDGLVLQATFYGAPVRPAPGVLMLHQRGGDRTTWHDLAQRLQAAGYAVLTVDLRGHGATGGAQDWTLAPGDVRAVWTQLGQLPGVLSTQMIVIGASVGANLGLSVCAESPGCVAAVLLSPGLDYRGITTADAMAGMGVRPVLIAASENDNNNPADSLTLDSMAAGDHRLVIYPAAGHGTAMFAAEPGLIDLITQWLLARVAPPAPRPTDTPPP
jgi:pimeloyl-ACP methyl ester carboxylesterase